MTKFATGAAGALTLALAFGGPAQAQDQVDQLLLPTPAPPAVATDGEADVRACQAGDRRRCAPARD